MRLSIVFILGFVFSYLNVSAQKISPVLLDEFKTTDIADCLIIFKDQADVSECKLVKGKVEKGNCVFEKLNNQQASQAELIADLKNLNIDHQSFLIVNMIKAKLSLKDADLISKRNDVYKITNNPWTTLEDIIEVDQIHTRGAGEPEWGIKMIQADSVWSLGFEGQEIVIAGQDTGYDWDNELIVSKYRGSHENDTIHDYNWHDAILEINPLNNDTIIEEFTNPCGLNSKIPCDDHGHGTHTMGTMVGSGEEDLIGVAPKASWIGCRNMDRGNGKPSTYLDCFEWFLAPTKLNGTDPDPALAPHVINNSWGCPEAEGCNKDNWILFDIAIENLKTAGILVVVSAGNDGARGCGSIDRPPSMIKESFAVGATGIEDSIAGFSSRGPVVIDSSFILKPDIAAPGVGVRSIHLNGQFRTWSGTSMAGPHVAGTVALILSANPSLAGEVETIENILRITAVDKLDSTICNNVNGQMDPNHVYGEGRLNALKAVEMALNILATEEAGYSKEFSYYPNPTSNILQIENTSSTRLEWNLFNQNGQFVRKEVFVPKQLSQIDLSGLSPGIYFIHWISKQYSGVERLVIQG